MEVNEPEEVNEPVEVIEPLEVIEPEELNEPVILLVPTEVNEPETPNEPVIIADPLNGKLLELPVAAAIEADTFGIPGSDRLSSMLILPDTIKPFLTTNSFAILCSVFHCPNRLLRIHMLYLCILTKKFILYKGIYTRILGTYPGL